jgi:phosphoglycerate dehydrogenase-like enzyme
MKVGGRILCLGVPHADTRRVIERETPEEFQLEFYENLGPQQARDSLAAADFLLVWSSPFPADMIAMAGRAKLIQKVGEGTDKIDIDAAAAAGIPVARTAGVNANSCAELAVLLMLAVMRRLPEAHAATAAGVWSKWEVRAGTQELRGKQVGLIGLGKIGTIVANIVAGFGAHPVYYRKHGPLADAASVAGARYCNLDALIAESDVVSLHVPLDATTKGMIGATQLATMKPNSVLINTARGPIVDEFALAGALAEHRIAGAGLDVFSEEPLPADHPLLSLSNVVLTPHVGGVTVDSSGELIRHAMDNFARVASGLPLRPADVVVAGPERA